MKVGSLFSGIGGLERGLELAGMEVAFQAEYDKQARSVLRHRWPNVDIYEDVKDVGFDKRRPSAAAGSRDRRGDAHSGSGGGEGSQRAIHSAGSVKGEAGRGRATLAPVDLICGGFPCQDYSVAGKRGGLVGDRGALWWEMHRAVAECRPTWVIGENVPGLLSSNGGADFLAIIKSLVQLGYGVTWATLDSQYFGVAQRRRRLFIVGHSGGVPRPEILALSEGLRGHPAPSREAGERADACLGVRSASGHDERGDLSSNIRVMASASMNAEIAEGFSPTLTTLHDGPPIAFTSGAHGAQWVGSSVPRRLTPIECERLQGFPDDWTRYYHDGKRVADGPRYRMLGNAVTVNVAEWIGRHIMEVTPHD